MNAPLDVVLPETRAEFFVTLRAFGMSFLSERVEPSRIAMSRLAIAEVQRSGIVANEFDEQGRAAVVQAGIGLFRHGDLMGFF